MTDQTPEARLAAALDGCDDFDCEHRLVRHDPINGDVWWMRCRAVAAALAADPTIAADLALAAAVRRLPEYWSVERYEDDWHVHDSRRKVPCIGHANTLTAAIEEALRDD